MKAAHVLLSLPEDSPEGQDEQFARQFAGELLLPEQVFREMWGHRARHAILGELIQIKASSLMAIVHRAQKLGLLEQSAALSFWKRAALEGWGAGRRSF